MASFMSSLACLLPALTLLFSILHGSATATIVPQRNKNGRLTGTSFGVQGVNVTYDYVIVGGGLAGSVVASRLTQHTNASVALIEAGSFYELTNGNLSQIPSYSLEWVGPSQDDWQPLIDWGLFTEPQINGERMHYAQGRNLGGSSGRNQMLYNRATKGAYQAWADQVGDQSYNWENMTRYLQRSLHFTPNIAHRAANATPMYNTSDFPSTNEGPVQLSYPGYVYPLSYHAGKAFESLGMKQIAGFATGELDGWGWWQFTIDPTTGLRSSSESSFLESSMERDGLTTYLDSLARKILFSKDGDAVGVTVTDRTGARPFTLSASREVIVSAGAYHSPQLLMVSGIGPAATLREFDIPIIAELDGVGQNMWDSCNIGGPVYEIDAVGYSSWLKPKMQAQATEELLKNGTGPLTNIGLDVGGWEKLPQLSRANLSDEAREILAKFPADWPELEYDVQSAGQLLVATDSEKQYGTIGLLMVATTSRGNMTIRSASNLDSPIINPNWLRTSTDQEVAIQGYRRAREAWKSVPIRVGSEFRPGANVTTDAQLLEYIKANIAPIHHASASCAMGKAGDPAAVVNSQGQVFGVQKLRVIDSSSFPFTPPGHTQAPTYAHAEKLVQDIIDDYLANC